MRLFRRSADGLFASESVAAHLIRGVAGICLLAWAIRHQEDNSLALAAALGALVAFRGCPLCWTIGLAESVIRKMRRSGE
jgi:hypothetical protein